MSGPWARLALALGAALGTLAWLLGVRRQVALEGLRRAFPDRTEPERRALARATYRQLGRGLAEIALARMLPDSELERLVRFDGWHRYEAARARGRGVVVAIAHFGNWELLGRACARRGVPLTIIGRRLRGRFNRLVVSGRTRAGMRELLDRGSSGQALAALRRGETLAVAVDQNMRPSRGIFVDFFGAAACTTPAAAIFSLRAGAPLIAAFPVRQPDGTHRVLVQGPFEPKGARGHGAVVALTQQVTRAVEEVVRAHPDHWYWLHRRWKTRPPC